jgi:hypothetical protein
MSPKTQLALASIVFALLWTTVMFWWNALKDLPGMIILFTTGALGGAAWYLGMFWLRRHCRHQWD